MTQKKLDDFISVIHKNKKQKLNKEEKTINNNNNDENKLLPIEIHNDLIYNMVKCVGLLKQFSLVKELSNISSNIERKIFRIFSVNSCYKSGTVFYVVKNNTGMINNISEILGTTSNIETRDISHILICEIYAPLFYNICIVFNGGIVSYWYVTVLIKFFDSLVSNNVFSFYKNSDNDKTIIYLVGQPHKYTEFFFDHFSYHGEFINSKVCAVKNKYLIKKLDDHHLKIKKHLKKKIGDTVIFSNTFNDDVYSNFNNEYFKIIPNEKSELEFKLDSNKIIISEEYKKKIKFNLDFGIELFYLLPHFIKTDDNINEQQLKKTTNNNSTVNNNASIENFLISSKKKKKNIDLTVSNFILLNEYQFNVLNESILPIYGFFTDYKKKIHYFPANKFTSKRNFPYYMNNKITMVDDNVTPQYISRNVLFFSKQEDLYNYYNCQNSNKILKKLVLYKRNINQNIINSFSIGIINNISNENNNNNNNKSINEKNVIKEFLYETDEKKISFKNPPNVKKNLRNHDIINDKKLIRINMVENLQIMCKEKEFDEIIYYENIENFIYFFNSKLITNGSIIKPFTVYINKLGKKLTFDFFSENNYDGWIPILVSRSDLIDNNNFNKKKFGNIGNTMLFISQWILIEIEKFPIFQIMDLWINNNVLFLILEQSHSKKFCFHFHLNEKFINPFQIFDSYISALEQQLLKIASINFTLPFLEYGDIIKYFDWNTNSFKSDILISEKLLMNEKEIENFITKYNNLKIKDLKRLGQYYTCLKPLRLSKLILNIDPIIKEENKKKIIFNDDDDETEEENFLGIDNYENNYEKNTYFIMANGDIIKREHIIEIKKISLVNEIKYDDITISHNCFSLSKIIENYYQINLNPWLFDQINLFQKTKQSNNVKINLIKQTCIVFYNEANTTENKFLCLPIY